MAASDSRKMLDRGIYATDETLRALDELEGLTKENHMINCNRLYNDAEPLVRNVIKNWLVNHKIAEPPSIELDELTYSISAVYAMKIQAQEAEQK